MALYTIKKYTLPTYDLCGFCKKNKQLSVEVHFNIDIEKFPKGVSVDMCPECQAEMEPHLNELVLMSY